MSAWYNKTMAFPGELNINYYKGDTHEFKIYPQKADNSIFQLDDYSNATFKIAEVRGAAGVADQITGSAIISTDGTHITCAISFSVALLAFGFYSLDPLDQDLIINE